MKKGDFQKIRCLLCGVGAMSVVATGCAHRTPHKVTNDILANNMFCQSHVGVIKSGDEYLYFWKDDSIFPSDAKVYYDFKSGEYLGSWQVSEWNNQKISTINSGKEILYSNQQVIPFEKCNPNVTYSYDVINKFTKDTCDNLVNSYFENNPFSVSDVSIYEILNLETNETSYIIGKKLKDTKVFNYESYMVEDYSGYAIKDMKVNFEQENLYYSEILDYIENYRSQDQSLGLELK